MKRTTLWMIAGGFGCAVAVMWYGLYWFYRVPAEQEVERVGGSEVRRVLDADFVSTGMADGAVPAIDDPQFESVGAADQYLKDDGFGIDVEVNGKHRFYPYQLLVWHQIVNDTFDDRSIVVTYSPLTFTGSVFDLSDQNPRLVFDVSGSVWNNNLLMIDDQTHSTWSQILGQGVSGERSGQALTRYPSSIMQWSVWKSEYPKGQVLSRETGADRDYTRDPYGNYLQTQAILYPLTSYDSRLPAKTIVFGVLDRFVYSLDHLKQAKEVKETNSDQPFVIRYNDDLETVEVFTLESDQEGERLPVDQSFWFLEAAAFPGLILYELP